MIGYLEGKILKKDGDKMLLLVNHVGYEVMLPAVVLETLAGKLPGDEVSLYIYYHMTERTPKPTLIGFTLEAEKEFFERFISVDAIGPIKAAKAMTRPVREIAYAIETGDASILKNLKGIGSRTAQKIIASLTGKMEKFALIRKDEPRTGHAEDFKPQVLEVLINQLGHKPPEAKRMIFDAMKRNPSISSAEELFDEVYKGEAGK